MRVRSRAGWFAWVVVAVLTGCAPGDDQGTGTSKPPGPDCSAVAVGWNKIARIDSGVVTSATEANGAVTMTARHLPPECQPPTGACPTGAIVLTQGGVADDDLDATVAFEAFVGGGAGSAAGLVMTFPGTGEAKTFIRQGASPVLEIYVTGMPIASTPTNATSGTLRVVRSTGVVTVTASAGADRVEVAAPMVIASGQILAEIGIYNRGDAPIDGETSVRFTDFRFAGSTAILSDPFDCNTIPP